MTDAHPSQGEIKAEVFDAAWSALQHSELIEIKTVRRKLSLHELRTFFQVVVPLVAKASLSRCGRDEAIEEVIAKLTEAAETAEKKQLWDPSTGKAGYVVGLKTAAEIVRSLVSDEEGGGSDPIREEMARALEAARSAMERLREANNPFSGINYAIGEVDAALSKHRTPSPPVPSQEGAPSPSGEAV